MIYIYIYIYRDTSSFSVCLLLLLLSFLLSGIYKPTKIAKGQQLGDGDRLMLDASTPWQVSGNQTWQAGKSSKQMV